MNLITIARVFGAVFILVGILGFIPAVTPNEHLLGLFHVNAAHNMVHILSGIAAFICAGAGSKGATKYFQIFGIVYGLVAILGLIQGDSYLLGLIANNHHDVWLHFLIAGASLFLGFVYPRSAISTAP